MSADPARRYAVVSVSGGARHRLVLEHMSRLADLEMVVPRLSKVEKSLVAARTFHPDRAVWRSRFAFDSSSARLLCSHIERQVRMLSPDALLVLFPILFSVPATAPYVVLTDNTLAVTRRTFPRFEPLTRRGWRRAIEREREVLLAASAIVTESQQARESIIDDYGIDAGRVAGTSIAVTLPIPAEPPAREDDLPDTVLYVATSFGELKGGDVLRRAWPLVKARTPSARLVIAGPAGELDELADATSTGLLPPDELARLYSEARVLVHPSRFESSLPNAIREAMAHALPVVASRIGGITEHAPPLTDLAEPGDAERVAELVSALLEDRERARLTGVRLHAYASAFQPAALADELLELLGRARNRILHTSPV